MRLMHLADLHIGIELNGTDISGDIEHALFSEALGRIYDEASAEKPVDALILAGDIFNRSQPEAEDEAMFGRLLSAAVGKGMKVFVCAGNHDSVRRISAQEELLTKLGVYITPPFSADEPVRVERLGDINVAMLPFITQTDVNEAFGEKHANITDAVRSALKHAGLPGERRCLLVAHLAADVPGDGLVGMLKSVDSSVFDGFAYTALGHIHTARNVGENVRYCGSPVCYSATEAKSPDKFVDIIDIDEDGVRVQSIKIQPKRPVRLFDDTFARLMSEEYPATEDYCYVTVSEMEGAESVAASLRGKFPNMLQLVFRRRKLSGEIEMTETPTRDPAQDLRDFYKMYTQRELEGEPLRVAEHIFRLTESAFEGGSAQLNRLREEMPSFGEGAQEGE